MKPDLFRHIKQASELIREVGEHIEESTPVEKVAQEKAENTILDINMEELKGQVYGS
jgi:hypothetical protein